jgi:hypothetical protein
MENKIYNHPYFGEIYYLIDIPEKIGNSVCSCDICKFTEFLLNENEMLKDDKWNETGYYHTLVAISLVKKENYEAAIGLLSQIYDDNSLPKPILYTVLDFLEKCCKETEDFKGAYEISGAKIQLFEKMLADI